MKYYRESILNVTELINGKIFYCENILMICQSLFTVRSEFIWIPNKKLRMTSEFRNKEKSFDLTFPLEILKISGSYQKRATLVVAIINRIIKFCI